MNISGVDGVQSEKECDQSITAKKFFRVVLEKNRLDYPVATTKKILFGCHLKMSASFVPMTEPEKGIVINQKSLVG